MNTAMMKPGSDTGQYGAINFLVKQLLSRVNTATLVKVVSCTNSGGVSPVGFVDVQPLVNQLDGEGNGHPLGVLSNLVYQRVQGGANAIVMDPQPGDIGIAVFASRDISKVKTTKKQANPGSWSTHSMSDGMYLGGVLNGTPTQYIQFTSTGITVHSPTKITLSAPAIDITGTTITSTGAWGHSGTMIEDGKNIGGNHQHSGVTTGSGNTGAPI